MLIGDNGQVTYAELRHGCRFDVREQEHLDNGGVVALGGDWTVSRLPR